MISIPARIVKLTKKPYPKDSSKWGKPGCPGGRKIRSKGKGRSKGYGKGKGPIGRMK